MLLWFLFAHFFTGFPEFFSSVYRHVCAQSVSHVWLCDPIDCTPPGSSVHGIFQARILKWVTISHSRGSAWPRDRTHVCCISCIGKTSSLPVHHLGSHHFIRLLCITYILISCWFWHGRYLSLICYPSC